MLGLRERNVRVLLGLKILGSPINTGLPRYAIFVHETTNYLPLLLAFTENMLVDYTFCVTHFVQSRILCIFAADLETIKHI